MPYFKSMVSFVCCRHSHECNVISKHVNPPLRPSACNALHSGHNPPFCLKGWDVNHSKLKNKTEQQIKSMKIIYMKKTLIVPIE